jgi:hypothetical protein
MPIGKYFKGAGDKVMSDMKSRYGADKGKQVFYATANKNGQKPGNDHDADDKPKRKTIGQRLAEGE